MLHPVIRPALLAFAALLLLSAAATAQTTSFQIDDQGNWVAQRPDRPPTPDEAVMLHARQLLADNKPAQAKSILTDWIEKNAVTTNPFLPQAYLLRGDAITADGNEFKALYDYETLIKGFPESEEYNRALERELEIGIKYCYGLKRIWLGIRWSDSTEYGTELLTRVAERSPGSHLAERAMIELADYYYRDRDLKAAAEAYEVFLANFPKSPYAQKARERRISSNIARFKGPNYDASGLAEARILIEQYAATDPAGAQRAGLSDAMVARLDESSAAQILEKARWYLRRNDLVSARATLQRLVVQHPQTVSGNTAVAMLRERGWEMPAPTVAEPPRPAAGQDQPPAPPNAAPTPAAPSPADQAPGK
jgi:tetratricopeptide (TPR) repeat protein